jgi:hypothetical protein
MYSEWLAMHRKAHFLLFTGESSYVKMNTTISVHILSSLVSQHIGALKKREERKQKEHSPLPVTVVRKAVNKTDAFDGILRPMTLQHHHKNRPFLGYLAKSAHLAKYLAGGGCSTKACQSNTVHALRCIVNGSSCTAKQVSCFPLGSLPSRRRNQFRNSRMNYASTPWQVSSMLSNKPITFKFFPKKQKK